MASLAPHRTRVLLLLHELSQSGAPRMALQVLQTLAEQIELRVISLQGGPLRSEFERLGPVVVLPEVESPRLQQSLVRLESRVKGVRGVILRTRGQQQSRLIHKWQPDVVYVNSLVALHLVPYLDIERYPAFLHVHETGSALHGHRLASRDLFDSWPRRYIAVSQHTQRSLRDEGVTENKIVVAPNFLSPQTTALLEQVADRKPQRQPGQPWIIGGAGLVTWTKGPELWLLMAVELTRLLGRGRVRFRWVGGRGTAEDDHFQRMARQLKINDLVELIPATSTPFEEYVQFDALAFTSWEDSFGLVVLENMVLGNLVACYAEGGGAPEVIGETGLIVPEFSPQQMAVALAEILQDTEQLTRLRVAARLRAATFTPSFAVDTLQRIIEDKLK
jgi:glycosyltransferase involved in cell wall biosynthesis